MRWLTVDHLKDIDEPRPGKLLHKAVKIYDTARLIPLCRLLGHKAAVDGTAATRPGNPGSRWVCCDRCGVRPDPQGSLDPDHWDIGELYAGPWGSALPENGPQRRDAIKLLKTEYHPPGPWPKKPTGELGMEIVVGRTFGGAGVELAVGCAGDDDTLSANLRLHRLGALYLYTRRHGEWFQRRLNGIGYDTRVIEFVFVNNGFQWRLWTKQGEWSRDTPRWRDGSVCLDLREWLWGPVRYWQEPVGAPENVVVRMPHGDDQEVNLVLHRGSTGRLRGRRRTYSWTVQWECPSGFPVREDDGWKGGSVYAAGVEVSGRSVEDRTWPMDAAAEIAASMTRQRSQHHFRLAGTAN